MKVDMQFMELSNMTYTSVAEFLRIFFFARFEVELPSGPRPLPAIPDPLGH